MTISIRHFIINCYNPLMNLIEIDSLDTPELEIYHKMRGNAFDADNSFVADSPKVVNMLLQSDVEINSLLATKNYYDQNRELISSRSIPKLFVGDKSLIETIVGHKIHHSVMMHGKRPANIPVDRLGDRIIMLDELSNMENVGSIARSAAALGVNSMAVPVNAPHPYGRRAIRVSMGHVAKLDIHRFESIKETVSKLKSLGYTIYGAEVNENAMGLSNIDAVPYKWVVIMGNEEHGLSNEALGLCDHIITIEMEPDIKSFNVSIAASIIMYQLRIVGK